MTFFLVVGCNRKILWFMFNNFLYMFEVFRKFKQSNCLGSEHLKIYKLLKKPLLALQNDNMNKM